MAKVTIAVSTLLDLSIGDLEEWSKVIDKDLLYLLFYKAQKQRDLGNPLYNVYEVEGINERKSK